MPEFLTMDFNAENSITRTPHGCGTLCVRARSDFWSRPPMLSRGGIRRGENFRELFRTTTRRVSEVDGAKS